MADKKMTSIFIGLKKDSVRANQSNGMKDINDFK